jgi:polysaccharide deacetylase family protein (PEP-CTERM system associated)
MKKSVAGNALTIDVEEWYQTILFYERFEGKQKESGIRRTIEEILLLLDDYKTHATFFVVASVAERYPDLIESIASCGHEIASHGYAHRSLSTFSPAEFSEDVARSIDILARITGRKILGYRAPTWSLTARDTESQKILQSSGLRYDSSIYPWGIGVARHRRLPHELRDGFFEFPPSTFTILGCHLPFAGGTFLRLLPVSFVKKKIREINASGYPALVYFHPWELEAPVVGAGVSRLKYAIQYFHADTVIVKIRSLLESFVFVTVADLLHLDYRT